MTPPRSRWRSRVAIGCGILLGLGLVVLGLGTFWFGKIFVSAGQAETAAKALIERFGEQDAYTPPADGVVPADRLEAFLAVRRTLQEKCPQLQEVMGHLEPIREAEKSNEPPSAGGIFEVVRGAFALAPAASDYLGARNQALLQAGMGIGEYSYVYVLAYLSGPEPPFSRAMLLDPKHPFRGREREAFIGMLRREVEALRGGPAGREALVRAIEAEAGALQRDEDRLPWPAGLPDPARGAIERRRADLDATFCAAGAGFDLATIRRHTGGVQID